MRGDHEELADYRPGKRPWASWTVWQRSVG
jgi:hypothetical protein